MIAWVRYLPHIIGLGALILVAAWIYDAGYDACNADRIAAVERAIDQAAELRAEDLELAESSMQRETETRIVYRTIHKEAARVETADCSDLGPDFVRVFNDAVRAADPASTPAE